MIQRAASSDPYVREILARHPKVEAVAEGHHPGVDFNIGSWHRSVLVGDPAVELRGLVELVDNNPMVCADLFSVPPPAATLALVALGPLAWAGLLLEPPAIMGTSPGESDTAGWLESAGWSGGATLELLPPDPERPTDMALVGIAAIETPESWDDIDALYEERFGRSFYVRQVQDWPAVITPRQPYAAYHMQYTPGDGESLLRVSVCADLHGKCGAAQVIHAMNVMSGFEESLGLE